MAGKASIALLAVALVPGVLPAVADETPDGPFELGPPLQDGPVVVTASFQVRDINGAPIEGITATGSPDAGTIRNQGRVGLSQNRVRNPEK